MSQAPWTNFWDETDPVADPLGPSKGWRRGDPLPELSNELPLFTVTDPDTGVQEGVAVADVQTSNAAHGAGGGLAAHNYWDNQEEFVQPLASILAASTA
ncbi:MAG: hypothetical protein DLM70_17125 [Chloroflexi bacterium]|nr:MAG: hypothetical protein DLM70_17125 [Chloroflexota bacterium]